jgi:hypothetical protein
MSAANAAHFGEAIDMEEVTKRFAREMAKAIAAASARDPRVAACRARARAAGFDMKVSVEAIIGFDARPAEQSGEASATVSAPPAVPFEVSGSDRQFLKSLRIVVDDVQEQV